MAVNYEKLITDLVKPLVINPEDVMVKKFSEDEKMLTDVWESTKKMEDRILPNCARSWRSNRAKLCR